MANVLENVLDLIEQASNTYIGDSYAALAATLHPFFRSAFILYIMLYGIGMLQGKIEMPVLSFVWRCLKISIIYGIAFTFTYYNTYLVDLFTNGPDALAASMVGMSGSTVTDAMGIVYQDAIDATARAFESDGYILPYLIGAAIFIVATMVVAYTLFLIGLSKIAMALLLGLGPVFLLCLMFDSTKRMFETWLQQMINFFLIVVLTVGALSLLVIIFQKAVDAIPANADNITLGTVIPMVIVGLIMYLLLKQIMGLASAIAGGIQLSTLGVIGGAMKNGLSSMDYRLRRPRMPGGGKNTNNRIYN